MQRVTVRSGLALLAMVLLFCTFLGLTSSSADAGGIGGCNPALQSCTVGVPIASNPPITAPTPGPSPIGNDGCQNTVPGDGCDPCPAHAAIGDAGLSGVCNEYLQNQYCLAIQADALGGVGAPTVAALTAAQVTTLNQQLQQVGCPPVVTAASLAQQAYATIRFPSPSGHRSPSETQRFQGFPLTWVNLWTYYWTDPGTWHDLSATATAAGLSATVTATPVALNFDPGDGSPAQGCAGPGRPWTDADGDSPPSNGACGYQYTHVTTAPITATETIVWKITWVGTGNTGGEIPSLSTSTSGQLNVLQIQAVIR